MNGTVRRGSRWAALVLLVLAGPGITTSLAQTPLVSTGSGTNICRLLLNFPAGEKVVFLHRWNGTSLTAKALLESVVVATGGELVVSQDYLTPFAFVPRSNPDSAGLVVHYQGSYEVPYINALRWMGPGGPTGADYQFPDNWWHLWVQGPAHIDQSLAWPDPLDPVELGANSAWFFGEFSGLADLILADGASVGLVYGNAGAPSFPTPAVASTLSPDPDTLEIHFSTIPGARYQLESRESWPAGTWVPTGDPISATGAVTTFTVPLHRAAGRAFYRLGVLP